MKIKGKTVAITGAGSPKGVGRGLLDRFHREGARIIAIDRDQSRLDDVAARGLNDVVTVCADVATPDGADRVVAAAEGRIDVLCNNAAALDLVVADELSEAEWNKILAVNLTAPFLLIKRVIPHMISQGAGIVINIGSIASLRGGRAGPAYTASKAGLIGLTQNVAVTYASAGIRCNAVCPGGMTSGFPEGIEISPRMGETLDKITPSAPPKADPQQIADVAFLLTTDDMDRVNGVALPVDGAWIAH
jgi:NAD(P)-dependent dehydrogenase (short-subunit alcohol dehydrogenase family)